MKYKSWALMEVTSSVSADAERQRVIEFSRDALGDCGMNSAERRVYIVQMFSMNPSR